MLLNAEKHYRKLRTGEANYSPEVSRASETWCMWRIMLKGSKGETKHKLDLVIISEKTGSDIGDHIDVCTVKMKINHIRKEHLRTRTKQEAYRKKHLKSVNRLKLWHKEKTKRQHKKCSRICEHFRMSATETVEYRDRGDLTQASAKDKA